MLNFIACLDIFSPVAINLFVHNHASVTSPNGGEALRSQYSHCVRFSEECLPYRKRRKVEPYPNKNEPRVTAEEAKRRQTLSS